MCLVREHLFHFYLHKKPILKESSKLYKCLKPLVLEKGNKAFLWKVLISPPQPRLRILLIRSPGKVTKFCIWFQSIPSQSPHTCLVNKEWPALGSVFPTEVGWWAEFRLRGRKATGSGGPHSKRPHPWPAPACLTLAFSWGQPALHSSLAVQLMKGNKIGLFSSRTSPNCSPWIHTHPYAKHWG